MRRESDGQHPARPPESAQFLRCGLQGIVDGRGLGEFLVEGMLATGRQRQRDRGMPGEVTDQLEVIVVERRQLRIACDGNHAKYRAVRYQRHDDRRTFTDVGESLDRILERIGDQR